MGKELGKGGEACVYVISQDLAAKIYHKPTAEHERKLEVMVSNPPDDPMLSQGHVSIAWPIDLLYSGNRFAGYLMPKVSGMTGIMEFYNPKTRRSICPLFSYRYLYRTAHNLAAAMRAIHERGYVVCDVNANNTLAADKALVTMIDTDSFQVPDPQRGIIYRCPVGTPEFTPPELQGKQFSLFDRSVEHDYFGLAVLIFHLLIEGAHPFDGVFKGAGDPPLPEERISLGYFPYSRTQVVPVQPRPISLPFDILPPGLQTLFIRCFESGHRNPKARPNVETWQRELRRTERNLIQCSINDQHLYGGHLQSCPWCERTRRLRGRDPFPSTQAVQQGQYSQTQIALPKPPQPGQYTSPIQTPVSPTTQPQQVTTASYATPTPYTHTQPPPPPDPVRQLYRSVTRRVVIFAIIFAIFRLIGQGIGFGYTADRLIRPFFLFVQWYSIGRVVICWGISGLVVGMALGLLDWLRKMQKPKFYLLPIASSGCIFLLLWGIGVSIAKVPVVIDLSPKNATVYVDDKPQYQSAKTPGLFWIRPGDHTIEVSANGYSPEIRKARLERDGNQNLTIHLHKDTGDLSIVCMPQSQIIIYDPDGRIIEQTNGKASKKEALKPGLYKVTAKALSGAFQPFTQLVEIKEGEVSEVNISLRRLIGTLKVNSQNLRGAKVYLDNETRSRGETPLAISDLSPGIHTIRISGGGYTASRQVKIDAYNTTSIDISLGEGIVTRIIGRNIEVNLGRRDGMLIGIQLRVLLKSKPIKDSSGNLLGFEESRYLVTSVQDVISIAEPTTPSTAVPKIGDTVKIIQQ